MKAKRDKRRGNQPEMFIPPIGFIRTPAPEKAEKYRLKSNSIGSFTRHLYDLDICTVYRQMDDLKGNYEYYGGFKYADYVKQLRESVSYDMSRSSLDADFYLDHFYYVLRPDNPSYLSFLGLFLSMSDPLLVIPKLEHHLKEFLRHDALGRGAESFYGSLEFTVCNAIRTAHFPEDYFIKHDKIINWVYGKRDLAKYQQDINFKLDALIAGINCIIPEQKISKEIIRLKPGRKKNVDQEVLVLPKMIEVFINDLIGYFNKNSHDALRLILGGKAEPSLIVNFDGHANQLIDVFRIYVDVGFIKSEKRAVANWLVKHFMYKEANGFVPFESTTAVERVIYSNNALNKTNRIPLSGLPKPQEGYYSNRKKSRSDTYSDG
jgi:hypothetical protein